MRACSLPHVRLKILTEYTGTVITIHQDNRLGFTQPITDRLRQRDTGLRQTADASLLVESLLDLGAPISSHR